MEHFDDIEKFGKGNRISPTASATAYPKGTLGVGNDGNVWLNTPDKNDVVRWQKEILIGFYDYLSVSFWNEYLIDFKIIIENFKCTITYKYESGISIKWSVPFGEEFMHFDTIQKFLNYWEKYDAVENIEKFVNGNKQLATGINFEIIRLLEKLSSLTFQKNPLRHASQEPEQESPQPKLKKGDRVEIPKTRKGREITGSALRMIKNAESQNYLYFQGYFEDSADIVWLSDTIEGRLEDLFSIELDKIKLYEGDITPFQQINFLRPSTEELDTIVKTMNYYSDKLIFVSETFADVRIDLEDGTKAYLEVLLDKVNNRIRISEPYTGIVVDSTSIKKTITNENLSEISEIYLDTLNLLLDQKKQVPSKPKFKVGDKVKIPTMKQGVKVSEMEKLPPSIKNAIEKNQPYLYVTEIRPKDSEDSALVLWSDEEKLGGDFYSIKYDNIELYYDCEEEAKKIQSGQVKAFYDLNKARIDKLNSDFSCKIVQALVSLSEYEKCGSPSSATLTKAKTDLLSKISKLKV